MSDGEETTRDIAAGDTAAGDTGTPERADTPHGPGMPDVSVTPGAADAEPAPPAAPPPPEPRRAPRIPEPPPARRRSAGGPGFGSYLWSHPAVLAVLIIFGIVVTGAVVDNIDGDSVTGASVSPAITESPAPQSTAESAATAAVASFDFAVIGPTGSASRGWTMEELDALPKRTVVAGGETVEGPSLLDLLEQSGEGGWRTVTLVRTPVVTLERDAIDEDWVLLFDPGIPRLTLVNPKFPRAAWFQQIVQFNIVE